MSNTQEVHVAFGTPDQRAEAIEKARAEASEAAGKLLRATATRQTHTVDARGRDVYELWVTLEEVPPEPLPTNPTAPIETPTQFSRAGHLG